MSLSCEQFYSGSEEPSQKIKEIIDDLENVHIDVLKEMVDVYYKEALPDWETLLKENYLFVFMKDTRNIHKKDALISETLTEYKNRLKKEEWC